MKRKHLLSVLGVSVLALMGMMAVSAVSAQAQTHLWLVGNNNWSALTEIDALSTTGVLLYLGAEVLCTHTVVNGALPTPSTATATIKFHGCHVSGNSDCVVEGEYPLGSTKFVLGLVEAKVKATLILLDVVKFEPQSGTNFARFGFERNAALLGVECLLLGAGSHLEVYNVTGSLCALVVGDELEFSKTIQLLYSEVAGEKHCEAKLKVGNNPAFLDAKILILQSETGVPGTPIKAH